MFAVWISVKSPIIETTLFLSWLCPVLSSQYHLTFWWKLLQCSVLTLQSHANLNKNFIFSSNHITAHSLNHKCFQPLLSTCVMESLWCQWFSIKLLSSKNNWKAIIIILWIHHLSREGEIGPGTEQIGDCWNKTDPLWRSQGTVQCSVLGPWLFNIPNVAKFDLPPLRNGQWHHFCLGHRGLALMSNLVFVADV